jgi:hypothetical protein
VSQININDPGGPSTGGSDRVASAGINLITVLVVLVVAVVLIWFLFMGPLRSTFGGTTNVNVNPPAPQEQPAGPKVDVNVPKVEVNPPAQQPSAPSKP